MAQLLEHMTRALDRASDAVFSLSFGRGNMWTKMSLRKNDEQDFKTELMSPMMSWLHLFDVAFDTALLTFREWNKFCVPMFCVVNDLKAEAKSLMTINITAIFFLVREQKESVLVG